VCVCVCTHTHTHTKRLVWIWGQNLHVCVCARTHTHRHNTRTHARAHTQNSTISSQRHHRPLKSGLLPTHTARSLNSKVRSKLNPKLDQAACARCLRLSLCAAAGCCRAAPLSPRAHSACGLSGAGKCRAQHPPATGVEIVIYTGTSPRRAPRGNRPSPHHPSPSRARLPPGCWQLVRPRCRGSPPLALDLLLAAIKKKKTFKSPRPNQNTQRQRRRRSGVVELRGRNGPHRRTAHQDRFRGTPCTQHTAPEQAQCRNRRRRTSRWCCDAAP
jgi:hypothetical protein